MYSNMFTHSVCPGPKLTLVLVWQFGHKWKLAGVGKLANLITSRAGSIGVKLEVCSDDANSCSVASTEVPTYKVRSQKKLIYLVAVSTGVVVLLVIFICFVALFVEIANLKSTSKLTSNDQISDVTFGLQEVNDSLVAELNSVSCWSQAVTHRKLQTNVWDQFWFCWLFFSHFIQCRNRVFQSVWENHSLPVWVYQWSLPICTHRRPLCGWC